MSNNTGQYNPRALEGSQKKRFYLSEGSNIFRILPPFKTLKESGMVAKFWAVYWLAGTKTKKDGKAVRKPIPTLRKVGQDKRVLQEDPIYQKIESLKAALEMAKKSNQPKELLDALEKTVNIDLALDKSYYLNVMNPNKEIGVLKIKYTGFQDLKRRLQELEQLGVDPINSGPGNGIFFDFRRLKDDKGKVVYTVELHKSAMRNPSTGMVESVTLPAPIDDVILARMEKEAEDLTTLYTVRSMEEQAMAATLDPSVIDRLFARPEAAAEEEEQVYAEEEGLVAPAPGANTKNTNLGQAVAGSAAPGAVINQPEVPPQQVTVNGGTGLAVPATNPQGPVATGVQNASAGAPAQTPPTPGQLNDFLKKFLQQPNQQ